MLGSFGRVFSFRCFLARRWALVVLGRNWSVSIDLDRRPFCASALWGAGDEFASLCIDGAEERLAASQDAGDLSDLNPKRPRTSGWIRPGKAFQLLFHGVSMAPGASPFALSPNPNIETLHPIRKGRVQRLWLLIIHTSAVMSFTRSKNVPPPAELPGIEPVSYSHR